MKRYNTLWTVLTLTGSLFSLQAQAAPDFFQVSPLKMASGGRLATGVATEGSFTITSNFTKRSVTIGRIDLTGTQDRVSYRNGWQGENSCIGTVLSPGSSVSCKIEVTAGASLPDTLFNNVRLRVKMQNLQNWTLSPAFNITAVNPSSDNLELLTTTPFAANYQQSKSHVDISKRADYSVKNNGEDPVEINSIAFVNRKAFSVSGSSQKQTLSGKSGTSSKLPFSANFSTSQPGSYTDTLEVKATILGKPVTLSKEQIIKVLPPPEVKLALQPENAFEPLVMSKGIPVNGKAKYRITNQGAPVRLSSVDFASADGRFSVDNPAQCNGLLAQGQSCDVDLTFATLPNDQPRIFSNALQLQGKIEATQDPVTEVFSPEIAVDVKGEASWTFKNSVNNLQLEIPYDRQAATRSSQAVLENTGLTKIDIPKDGIVFIGNKKRHFVLDDRMTSCGSSLAVGQNCTIGFNFNVADNKTGHYSAQLQVTGNAENGRSLDPAIQKVSVQVVKQQKPNIKLILKGDKPLLSYLPLDKKGDATDVGWYTLANKGNTSVTIKSLNFSTPDFSVAANTCVNTSLAPAGECKVAVRFLVTGQRQGAGYSDNLMTGYRVSSTDQQQTIEPALTVTTLGTTSGLDVVPEPGLPKIAVYSGDKLVISGLYKVTNTGQLDINGFDYRLGWAPYISAVRPSEQPACDDMRFKPFKGGESCYIKLQLTLDSMAALESTIPVYLKPYGRTASRHPIATRLEFSIKTFNGTKLNQYLKINKKKDFATPLTLGWWSNQAETTAVYQLTNIGIEQIKLEGLATTDNHFSVLKTGNDCAGKMLLKGQTCSFKVHFLTDTKGLYSTQLNLNASYKGQRYTVGTGPVDILVKKWW